MTEKEYVEKLKALTQKTTFYRNKYPYNLGLVAPPKSVTEFKDCRKTTRKNYNPYEEIAQSFDCNNLVKALLNGYDINNMTIGYYQVKLSQTGDCTEYNLFKQCTDISSDFTKLDNRPRMLYMSGHIGSYLGEVVKGCFNVVECSPNAVIGNGVRYSWVDSDGTRRNQKGGVILQGGKWKSHGLMTKWLSYTPQGSNSNEKPKVDYSKYPVLKKGSTGKYVKIMQQLLVDKGYDPKGVDGIFGNGCLACVKKYQKENVDVNGKKLVVDGCVGQKTWGSLYKTP